ncbi:putative RNase H-like nuclease (RuvC/YqgF family) [Elusimicrobium posterum]|uniref:hypothetical protein n=1 Tax=Elusimicrobium posterum TaxID=3116653 RepID=UPI003C78BC94
MKKITMAILAVFMLGVIVNAQPGEMKKEGKASQKHEMRKGPDGEKRESFKEMFKAKMAEEKALHDNYAAAKTDAEKKTAEANIKAYVEKDSDKMIEMFDNRIKKSEEQLKEAKAKLKEVKKNRKDMDNKRISDIKDGKLGPKGPRGEKGEGPKCEDGKCPFGPKDGKKGPRGPKPEAKKVEVK